MTGLLVVTHGRLARELVAATVRIVGDVEQLEAVSLDWDDDVDRARETISEAVARLDVGDGVLIVTDMFGGTPSNICLSILEPGRVEIVTGVNLPMLIKFANLRERLSAAEIAGRIAAQGRQAIQVASEVLEPSGDAGSSENDA